MSLDPYLKGYYFYFFVIFSLILYYNAHFVLAKTSNCRNHYCYYENPTKYCKHNV